MRPEHCASDAADACCEAYSVDGEVGCDGHDTSVNSLNEAYARFHRTEHGVGRSLVSAAIHFDSVLLILEGDRDPFR